MMKTEVCRLCGASFVKEYKNQQYCDDCIRNKFQKIQGQLLNKKLKNEK